VVGPEHESPSGEVRPPELEGAAAEIPLSQTVCPVTFAAHAVLTATAPPWDVAVAQALAGSVTCEPATVRSPGSSTTQHADALQVPVLPAGSWIATLRSGPAETPPGRVAVQVETSRVAGVAAAKHPIASKHPSETVLSPSVAASAPPELEPVETIPPSGPSTVVGVTAADTHAPWTHVCPAGHELAPASPASPAAGARQA
jgi:hypothetical protein